MKRFLSLILIFVLLFATLMPLAHAESTDTFAVSYGFTDFTQYNNFWTYGTYRCGTDFPAGEYYILSLFGAEALYDVCDNPNDFTWSYQRIFRKISINQGQYILLSFGAIMVPASEFDTSNWREHGVFEVGKDIPSGEYLIETITDVYDTELVGIDGICGAYQITDGDPTATPLECNVLFSDREYLMLHKGQNILINNANLILISTDEDLSPYITTSIQGDEFDKTSVFNSIDEFNCGLALVEDENGNCGFVDTSGCLVVPCIYSDAFAFNEGLAAVKYNDKWGFVDTTGTLVIQCQFDDAFIFSEGLAAVIQDGKCGFINVHGEVVIPFAYTNDVFREGYFSEGLVAVEKDDKWGYVNANGTTVIPFVYEYAYPFNNGIARVNKDGLWGFIDMLGNVIIPFEYDFSYIVCADWPCSFSEGLSRVQKNGKWGYINTDGTMVIPCIFDNALEFSEGYAAICKDDKWGFIDTTGKIVIPCEFDAVFQSFRGGYAKVYSKYDPIITSWGLIDKTGEWVFAENYEYSNYNEGYFSLMDDGELIIQRQETPMDIPMDTVIDSSKVRENYDALLKEAIIEKYNTGDYDAALLFIADLSELDAEIVSIKENIEKHHISAYCIDGDLNGALDYISGIAEKSDGILSIESEIKGFMEQYGKWLGKWGYKKNDDRYSLWIKSEYTDEGLILRFEEGKTKKGDTIVFYLHESKNNTLVYHSNKYDVFAYTTLKYVEDGIITTSTYNKSTDHTTSPSKLYRID